MSKFAWIAILGLFFSQISFAKEQRKVSQATLKKFVSEYYLSKAKRDLSQSLMLADDCEIPNKGACISMICSKMPSYSCDDRAELREVALACSNVDGRCVESVCGRMPNYSCDDFSETKAVALECRGLIGGECIDVVCSKMPAYNCDDFSELKEVIAMCKNP